MAVDFVCPHCGARTQVGKEHVGRTSPCASCGREVSVPAAQTKPTSSGREKWFSPPSAIWAFVVFPGVAVLAILAIVVAGKMREAAQRDARAEDLRQLDRALEQYKGKSATRRDECVENLNKLGRALKDLDERTQASCVANLERISQALHAYREIHGTFPPPYTVDENGNRLHSWRVLILPFLNEETLYNEIRLDEPWDSEHNRAAATRMPDAFRCDADRKLDRPPGVTDYVMVTGPGTIGEGPKGTPAGEIADGASNTLCIVEMADSGINWMEPRDFEVETMSHIVTSRTDKRFDRKISSCHSKGVNAILCDGLVIRLPFDMAPKVLEALFTKAGGEKVDPHND